MPDQAANLQSVPPRFASLISAGLTSTEEVDALTSAQAAGTLCGRAQARYDIIRSLSNLFASLDSKERRF